MRRQRVVQRNAATGAAGIPAAVRADEEEWLADDVARGGCGDALGCWIAGDGDATQPRPPPSSRRGTRVVPARLSGRRTSSALPPNDWSADCTPAGRSVSAMASRPQAPRHSATSQQAARAAVPARASPAASEPSGAGRRRLDGADRAHASPSTISHSRCPRATAAPGPPRGPRTTPARGVTESRSPSSSPRPPPVPGPARRARHRRPRPASTVPCIGLSTAPPAPSPRRRAPSPAPSGELRPRRLGRLQPDLVARPSTSTDTTCDRVGRTRPSDPPGTLVVQ